MVKKIPPTCDGIFCEMVFTELESSLLFLALSFQK